MRTISEWRSTTVAARPSGNSLLCILALMTWGDCFTEEQVLVLGDNTGRSPTPCLSRAVGRSSPWPGNSRGGLHEDAGYTLLAISRLNTTWSRTRCLGYSGNARGSRRGRLAPTWAPAVAHGHSPQAADPKGCEWPAVALSTAVFVAPPRVDELWRSARGENIRSYGGKR